MSHNDLYILNILIDEKKGVCHLIDYEYMGLGYLGSDLVNIFLDSSIT